MQILNTLPQPFKEQIKGHIESENAFVEEVFKPESVYIENKMCETYGDKLVWESLNIFFSIQICIANFGLQSAFIISFI